MRSTHDGLSPLALLTLPVYFYGVQRWSLVFSCPGRSGPLGFSTLMLRWKFNQLLHFLTRLMLPLSKRLGQYIVNYIWNLFEKSVAKGRTLVQHYAHFGVIWDYLPDAMWRWKCWHLQEQFKRQGGYSAGVERTIHGPVELCIVFITLPLT